MYKFCSTLFFSVHHHNHCCVEHVHIALQPDVTTFFYLENTLGFFFPCSPVCHFFYHIPLPPPTSPPAPPPPPSLWGRGLFLGHVLFSCCGLKTVEFLQCETGAILWLEHSTLINTFAASYLNTQGFNNSCLKSPASTLVDLTFQSRALRSFSLNQLRNLSL